jgi:hypothetical protein
VGLRGNADESKVFSELQEDLFEEEEGAEAGEAGLGKGELFKDFEGGRAGFELLTEIDEESGVHGVVWFQIQKAGVSSQGSRCSAFGSSLHAMKAKERKRMIRRLLILEG